MNRQKSVDMGYETPSNIPIIEFSNQELSNRRSEWESVKSQVRKALEDYGCFQATIIDESSPDQEYRTTIFDSVKELFDQPLEMKKPMASETPSYSYTGQLSVAPLYESFIINNNPTFDNIESFVLGVLPQRNSSCSKALLSLTKKMLRLQETIRTMIVESLGVEKYLDEHIKSIDQSVRMLKYEGPKTTGAEVGLIPHRDNSIITLLYQNHVHGLEVQDKVGNWIKVEPPPNSFTVVTGESLNAWANGRFHVPLHRVTMTGNEARYCIGLFILPKEGHIIEAPKELVDEEHPLLYKPFDYSEFKKFRRKAGVLSTVELKSFCGV